MRGLGTRPASQSARNFQLPRQRVSKRGTASEDPARSAPRQSPLANRTQQSPRGRGGGPYKYRSRDKIVLGCATGDGDPVWLW
jgi:hypothetical protein